MDGQRLKYLGAFAETLGIRPWETDLLELGEFYALCDYIERRDAALRQTANGGPDNPMGVS